jgi:hypothetical protein
VDTGENGPMTEREAATEILMQLPEKNLKINKGFHERTTIFNFIFFFNQAA